MDGRRGEKTSRSFSKTLSKKAGVRKRIFEGKRKN